MSKKQKNNHVIVRKLTENDMVSDKMEHLGIDKVIKHDVYGKDVIIYKHRKEYIGFLKINLLITPSLLTNNDFVNFQNEWRSIMSMNDKTRMYAVKKSPNFVDIDLELDNLVVNDKTAAIKQELVNEYNNCNMILEYYIQIKHKTEDGLLSQMEYMVGDSRNLAYMDIIYPLKNDNDYIYENLVLGGLDVIYNPDHIIYNQDDDPLYTKYIYVMSLKPKQRFQFWQGLTKYPNADVLIEVEKVDQHKSEFILNKCEEEIEEKTSKNKAQNRKLSQEAAILNNVVHSVVNGSDILIKTRFVIKFSGYDKIQLEKDIKDFKKDNKNFVFMEKLDNYEALEKYYLGADNNTIPQQTLTLNILTKGVGLFFSTFIQNEGILLCNRNNTITIINREKVKTSDGQNNFNEFICGSTSSGKSTMMKKFITYTMLRPNDRIISVDVNGEYLKLCQYFDGQVVHFNNIKTTDLRLNPFDLIVDINGVIENKKIVEFLGFLAPSIQRDADFQVDIENYFLKLLPTIEGDITLSTFYDTLVTKLENNEIESSNYSSIFIKILENIISNYPIFDGITNINLNNRFINFNIKYIKDDYELKMAVNYIISRLVNKHMVNNKFEFIRTKDSNDYDELLAIIEYAKRQSIDISKFNQRIEKVDPNKVLDVQDLIGDIKTYVENNHPKLRYVIDEAHNLLDDVVITKFLLTLSREGRKFNTGLFLATQTPSELLNGATPELADTKRKLWEMIPYKYFLKVNDLSGLNVVDDVGRGFFTPSEIDFLLKQAEKGQGFVMYNGQKHLIGTLTSQRLLNIFDGGVGN